MGLKYEEGGALTLLGTREHGVQVWRVEDSHAVRFHVSRNQEPLPFGGVYADEHTAREVGRVYAMAYRAGRDEALGQDVRLVPGLFTTYRVLVAGVTALETDDADEALKYFREVRSRARAEA